MYYLPVKNSENKYGYINERGELVIDYKYDFAGNFSCGCAYVLIGSEWGYINKRGRFVIPAQYKGVNPFDNFMAIVQNKDGEFGIISAFNKVIVPFGIGTQSFYHTRLNRISSVISCTNEMIEEQYNEYFKNQSLTPDQVKFLMMEKFNVLDLKKDIANLKTKKKVPNQFERVLDELDQLKQDGDFKI